MTVYSILPNAASVAFIMLSFAEPLAETGISFISKSQTISTLVALVSEMEINVSNWMPITGPFSDVCINFWSGFNVTN